MGEVPQVYNNQLLLESGTLSDLIDIYIFQLKHLYIMYIKQNVVLRQCKFVMCLKLQNWI